MSERESKRIKLDDNDDDDSLSAAECQCRCEQFVSVTGTDEALAQYYLQDVNWNVESALNTFYEASSTPSVSKAVPTESQAINRVDVASSSSSSTAPDRDRTDVDNSSANSILNVKDLSDRYIKLISWNIDGIDQNNILNRTRGVVDIIKREKPDIVFLQEVIPQTFNFIELKCDEYECIAGSNLNYFTALMFKKRRVKLNTYYVVPFPTTMMMRNLLCAQINIGEMKMRVFTSHLESTKDHSQERKKQLQEAFKQMKDSSGDEVVIFGGDLNLRDKELTDLGEIPKGISDLWEVNGHKQELRYTWDSLRNSNCPLSGGGARFRPRMRFDRIYLRHDTPTPLPIKPVHFGLRGIEKLTSCQRHPSDHWALLAVFEVM